MTNHENLSEITDTRESVEIESVKMLLGKIYDDVQNGVFDQNWGNYLRLYKAQVEWLNSECEV